MTSSEKTSFVRIDGFNVDGTASNTGAHGGFLKKVTDELPWMHNTVCIGHTANLPMKKASEDNAGSAALISHQKELNAYYRTSSVTLQELQE